MTQPTPTLLELLEEAAQTCAFEAAKRRAKTGQNDAGRVLDGAMALIHEQRAARLRSASQRLREEMAEADRGGFNVDRYAREMLVRINGGPLPTPAAPTCAEATCKPWCGQRWNRHVHPDGDGPIFQDTVTQVQRTCCYCSPACRDAGHPMNPRR